MKKSKAKSQRYIILPPRGIISDNTVVTPASSSNFLRALEGVRTSGAQVKALVAANVKTRLKVVDSIAENGAKLVEISEEDIAYLKAEHPGVRIVPEKFFRIARVLRKAMSDPEMSAKAAKAGALSITVVSQADGTPISGANVVAFTDFEQRFGAGGLTNAKGKVSLALGASSKKLERLYVYAESGFWSALQQNITLKNGATVQLKPIDLAFTDELRFFYGQSDLADGTGVTVGVIDTGSGPHKDLVISGGVNTVDGEDPSDNEDDGVGHGTHVAGMIAARGTSPDGVRGVAPGVKLMAYRVFPEKTGTAEPKASNFAIAKAIAQATADQCDILNMSLGGGDPDQATSSAIDHARASGTLVIVAAGNGDRSPVSFPASDPRSVAISALGRKGTFPGGTVEFGDIVAPFGTDKNNYIAEFSNVGPEILLTGPGVGIISSFPDDRYAVMDGTSMATPAVVGAAAKLLAGRPDILNMPRDQVRSNAMLKAILEAAQSLGFTSELEGKGMIVLPAAAAKKV